MKINNYLDPSYEMTDEDIISLEKILLEANRIYSNSGEDTGLTDTEYDYLVSRYEDLTNKELPIGAPLSSLDKKVSAKYLTLRGTLAKIYKLTDEDILTNKSQKTIYDWITKIKNIYKKNTGKELDTSKLQVQVVPKYDGVSIVCEFTKNGDLIRALTRGDTDNNISKDVTNVIRFVMPKGPFENAKSEYAVKCEAMILNSDFNYLNEIMGKDYHNTRAVAVGIINTDDIDPDMAKYLHLIQLRYAFYENGEESEQYMSNDMYDQYFTTTFDESSYAAIRDWAFKHATVNPGYRCDGAVICILDEDVRKALGRTGTKQNYEVAFKFTTEYETSIVKDIIFQVGNFGNITPVIEFKKVKMKGNDVKRATLNYSDFMDYKLAKGDEIIVTYDIIPGVIHTKDLKRSGNKRIKAPSVCPECGVELSISDTGKRLYCENPKCACRIKGEILNYMTKMGIENISYETVNDFYDAGYLTKLEDIYKLEDNAKKLSKIPGYGTTSIAKICKSIDNSKVVSPSRFLGSIGIEGVSIKKFHDLLQHVGYNELIEYGLNNDPSVLVGLPGIKEKTSERIINGIHDNKKLIENLENYLTILDEPLDSGAKFSVTFTKVRDEGMEKFIRSLGGEVNNSSVTKDTTILVVPKLGVKSSKVSKAEKYNIPVIEISGLKSYLERNPYIYN